MDSVLDQNLSIFIKTASRQNIFEDKTRSKRINKMVACKQPLTDSFVRNLGHRVTVFPSNLNQGLMEISLIIIACIAVSPCFFFSNSRVC